MAARCHPADVNPTWEGYSVGRWENDTLVVESMGFRDDGWLDVNGAYFGNTTKVTERFRRMNYGRVEIDDDHRGSEGVLKPFTVRVNWRLEPDGQLIEFICSENQRFVPPEARGAPAAAGSRLPLVAVEQPRFRSIGSWRNSVSCAASLLHRGCFRSRPHGASRSRSIRQQPSRAASLQPDSSARLFHGEERSRRPMGPATPRRRRPAAPTAPCADAFRAR